MIWLKRIAPFLIIAIAYFGNNYYQEMQIEKTESDEKRYALITAMAWVGSMKHRDEPNDYICFRDSLLDEHNLSNDSLKMFVASYSDKAEDLGEMAVLIKSYVDSLLKVEDSLKQAHLEVDSLRLDSLQQVADSLVVDSLEIDR